MSANSQKGFFFRLGVLCILFLLGALSYFFVAHRGAPVGNTGGSEPGPALTTATSQDPTLDEPVMNAPKPVTKPIQTAAPAPVRVGEVGLSVAETLTGLSPEALTQELDDFVALKVSWIRLDFDWAVIQRGGPSSYDWSRIDRVVAAANKRHLQLLPILVYTPSWARSPDCNSNRCPPEDVDTFARFAAAAAERYAPQGIHTWEIWNEPNSVFSWRPAADHAQYTALLKAAYLNIKNIDPDAHIISGGLAQIDSRNGSIAPREYLAALYKDGAGAYFDAVGFHPYSFPVSATYSAPWNAWQQMQATNPSMRDIMIANGDRDKQIWITEYGAPTGGPGNASAAYDARQNSDHVTETRQKEMLVDAITDAAQHDWLGPFFWYSYKDLGTSQSTTENFYGLLREDGSPKPAYDALLKR